MSCNFYLIFNFFVPKAYFLKALDGALFRWTLWVFLLGFPIKKLDQLHEIQVFTWIWNMLYSKIIIITFF
jgi:hypothetical protein